MKSPFTAILIIIAMLLMSGSVTYGANLCDCKYNTDFIHYYDNDTFDTNLSDRLKKCTSGINISSELNPIKTDSLPKRLEQWLSIVEQKQGEVQIKADPSIEKTCNCNTKGFDLDLTGVGKFVVNKYKDAVIYEPAKYFNVILYYNKNHPTEITRILFYKK